MFTISQADLPVLPTCQALLIIDLQNDLVSPNGPLPVNKPEGFVKNILNLATDFRETGKVIWIRSEFEKHRPINDESVDAEMVITDVQVNAIPRAGGSRSTRKNMTQHLQDVMARMGTDIEDESGNADEEPRERSLDEQEPFLTIVNGVVPKILLPLTPGANHCNECVPFVRTEEDIIFAKSHYSAFKSGSLLQALRGQFVTELYIVGALTNISVFATAMDAAKYGYQITLISDCLGYRSQERHSEALRQLDEATGCDIFTSAEVIEQRRTRTVSLVHHRRPTRKENPGRDSRGVQQLLGGLKSSRLARHGSSAGSSSRARTSASKPTPDMATTEADSVSSSQRSHSSSRRRTPVIKPKTSEPKIEVDDQYAVSSGEVSNHALPTTSRRPRETSIGFDDDDAQGAHEVTEAILAVDDSLADDDSYCLPPPFKRDRSAWVPSKIKHRVQNPPSTGRATDLECTASIDQASPTHAILSAATEALQKVSLAHATDVAQAEEAPENPPEPKIITITAEPIIMKTAHIEPETKGEMEEVSKHPGQNSATTEDAVTISVREANIQTSDPIMPVMYGEEALCEGDTRILKNLLPDESATTIFDRVRDEVRWQTMSHLGGEVPRLVAVQGEVSPDGSIPVYRHPSDESPPFLPYTSAVSEIRLQVEKALGHRVNHCLIQLYRGGTDFISEHSDKTLDIDPSSFIANVSLGATRTMTFRTKRPMHADRLPGVEGPQRITQKAPLPHNSLCKMGLATNAKWLHSIRADKRRLAEKTSDELSYDGQRISLTFRLISTFLTKDLTHIYGQGATSKTVESPVSIIHGPCKEATAMINAFGAENQSSDFDWQATYGPGFDVLHMTSMPRLFLSRRDSIANIKIRLMLSEYNISYSTSTASPPFLYRGGASSENAPEVPEDLHMRFVDSDTERTTAEGDFAIMIYIETFFGPGPERESVNKQGIAKEFSRVQAANDLQKLWTAEPFSVKPFRKALAVWNEWACEEVGKLDDSEGGFIAGKRPCLADYSFWPVLREVVEEWGWAGISSDLEPPRDMKGLEGYWTRMQKREGVRKLEEVLKAEKERAAKGKGKVEEIAK